MFTRKLSTSVVAIVATLALGVSAPPALAAVSLSEITAAPESVVAGAHADFRVKFRVEGGETLDDMTLHLPPGVIGDPSATVRCSQAQLEQADIWSDGCPSASRVGRVDITTSLMTSQGPLVAHSWIYNMEAVGEEPARLGMALRVGGLDGSQLAPFRVLARVTLRTTPGDEGLDAVVSDMPKVYLPD